MLAAVTSCDTYDPSSMPWPPTGDWRIATKSAVVDVTFGVSKRTCTEVAGMYGNYQDCKLVIPVSGRVRETSDGRDFTLQGTAVESDNFYIYFIPVGSNAAATSTVSGCAETGYQFTGGKEAPDIVGDLDATCYSQPIAGRLLISADEIRWTRTEPARLQRR
jgi:hypothetical protein